MTVHLNMDHYGQVYTRRLKRKDFDIRICDLDIKKVCINNMNDLLRDQEVDTDYVDLLNFVIKTIDPEKDFICEDQNEYENDNKSEYESEDEDVYVDENIKDPDYCVFLENLIEHGNSYKLKICQDDVEPRFLCYEEQDNSAWRNDLQTCIDDSGDEVTVSEDKQIKQQKTAKRRLNDKSRRISTKKEACKRKKINDHNKTIITQPGMTTDPCYSMFLQGKYPEIKREEEEDVECEKHIATCDSDSDVVILDNVKKNCSEVNNKQLVLAEKEPSLREKLMYILKQPYDENEYKELSEYIEQEKPVCQLKPLRHGRSRLFANSGVNKSLLNYGPEMFRRMLNAAQKDKPKALNLLRMFRFWLEHVPNDDVFQPWKDKQMLKVRPSEKNAKTHKQQLLLEYK